MNMVDTGICRAIANEIREEHRQQTTCNVLTPSHLNFLCLGLVQGDASAKLSTVTARSECHLERSSWIATCGQ